jgi:hypothetical protein
MMRFTYFSRGPRKRGLVIQVRCIDTNRLLLAEELALGMSKLPIMTPGRPLPTGTPILATRGALASLGDKIELIDAIPAPPPKISRSAPGRAASASAEGEAREGASRRKP